MPCDAAGKRLLRQTSQPVACMPAIRACAWRPTVCSTIEGLTPTHETVILRDAFVPAELATQAGSSIF